MGAVVRIKGKDPGTLTEQRRLRISIKEPKALERSPFRSIIVLKMGAARPSKTFAKTKRDRHSRCETQIS
jgi:hypothetical protein